MEKQFLYLCMCAFFISSCTDESFVSENVDTPTLRGVINKTYYSLGVSYDVTDDYLDIDATKYPVIDIDAFLKSDSTSFITNPTTSGDLKIYSGATADDFINEIKNQNSIGGSITGGALTGSIKGTKEFNSKTTFSTKYSYGRADVLKRVKRIYLNADATMLQKYLYPEFIRDLNKYTPDQFVEMYGTHVLLDITIGGRLQFNYRSTIEETSNTTEKKRTVEAGVKFAVGSFGADRQNSHTKEEIKTWSNKNATWKTWILYIGGEGSGTSLAYDSQTGYQTTSFNLHAWESSVNDKNAGIIEINWAKTYPIYDFISDVNKKAQIKSAFDRYINSKKVEVVKVKPLYRLWDRKADNTFYTTSEVEANYYRQNYGLNWDYGYNTPYVQGYVLDKQVSGTSPLYRLWDSKAKNTFYTTSEVEANYYRQNYGLNWDYGYNSHYIQGYILNKEGIDNVPLYRLWNGKAKNTFYTTSEVEANYYRQNCGYNWDYGYNTHYIQGYLLSRN